ncbi:DUF2249 domain-containing protein [Actinomyces sp.]|uniref:DUF2249 domain-containing protein n=1 Tax=Actinomyces sp. TaxID=29317 RepID=UPI0028989155|nr:DUF2249 domain-containing protein [Actinomyces sp.]
MSDQTTLPEAAPADGHQMFRLVDAEKLATSGGACGCGGHGHAAAPGQSDEAGTAAAGGCGCGGHGHRAAPAEDAGTQAKASGGCGCGGHGHAAASEQSDGGEDAAAGGCGCGGHGHGGHHQAGAHATPTSDVAAPAATEELVIHSIPRAVRKVVLFAAVDQLPVGEGIVLVAPHQPEPLFEHLRSSDSHYRVETLDAGPEDWRYRVTRLS